jgi:hypothetical protein
MNEFERDDRWQKEMRDRILGPYFYGKYAFDGRYVFIDKGQLASIIQKRYAVDTIVQGRHGTAWCIEEKIVRWPQDRDAPYTAFCLETNSCTVPGHESDGWMKYGQADLLLYCFQTKNLDELDCHLLAFGKLQKWFWPVAETFNKFKMRDTLNRTEGRLVDIDAIPKKIAIWRGIVGKVPLLVRGLQ